MGLTKGERIARHRANGGRPRRKPRMLDLHIDEHGDSYRAVAECEDELTEMLFIGKDALSIFGFHDVQDLTDALSGDLGKMLAASHLEQCASCMDALGHPDKVRATKTVAP